MGNVVRMRCPCCGMLAYQDRLNRTYPFEFVRQEMTSKGRGRGSITYHRGLAADSEAAKTFQALLAMKMVDKARKMLEELDAPIEIRVYGLDGDEGRGEEEEDTAGVCAPESGGVYEIDDYDLEVGVAAGFEAAADIAVGDARWSFWRWVRGRRGREVAALGNVSEFELHESPNVEYTVGVALEVNSYGDEA